MDDFQHKTISTLAIKDSEPTEFYAIPVVVAQVLGRAGATIHQLDLGLRGDSIYYASDHGTLHLTQRLREDGVRQIAVTCASWSISGCEQLCFQITRALASSIGVASIFWQPTGMRVRPEDFTWDAMTGRPRHSINLGVRKVLTPAIGAVA